MPSRNRSHQVVSAVASILENDYPERFEVVVVDQSDNNQTAIALRAFDGDSRLRYHRSSGRGASLARNEGTALARGRVIAFTDDDSVVQPNWLSSISRELARHPLIGILFGAVLPGPHDPSAGTVPAYRTGRRRTIRSVLGYSRNIGMGANLSVRREAIEGVGGFDPLLGPGGRIPSGENHDLALRMLVGGWTVLESPRVEVVHYGFRTHDEYLHTTRRNWTAIGAVHAKFVRSGHVGVAGVIGFNMIMRALLSPAAGALRGPWPLGLQRQIYYWRGFLHGLRLPIEPAAVLFVSSQGSRERRRS